ncbi:FAD-dependent oxidoreductase [Variovorax sp. J31P207]|uniref:FAD-dependent oxidoreductase n=1 Tax=Variovorax sp. J31P207 TaxID=3053510 RepID=UPI0025773FEE|nr:FAD-dependent oxidoreductase [Variovorax sp. J31P207]MDM0066852.1 FAD-dependent oxidoreductase [Variovorax sp. J31P207]
MQVGDADLVVVGAGAGGMTAALVAALEGLRVILCEASDQVGGTTSTSAGTLWVPGNPHGARAGHVDSAEAATRYLDALIGPEDERGLRRAFLDTVPQALDYLEQRSAAVRFASAGKHPDYLPFPDAAVSGRAVSPLSFDGRLLGSNFVRIRPPIAEFMLLGGMMVGKSDIQALVGRWGSWPHFLQSARLVLRYAADRLRYPRGTRLVMGNALVARLFQSLCVAGVDVRFNWRLQGLETSEGRVVHANFETPDGDRRLSAERGVVLATGGVGHGRLRGELTSGGERIFSLACGTVRAEGIEAARSAGAQLEQHSKGNFFWQPVSIVPHPGASSGLFPHLFLDRAKPGLIAVDPSGRRFVNEAASYHHFVEGMLRSVGVPPGGKAWLVCDAEFVRRFGLGVIPPGTRSLRRWVSTGYVTCAPTLEALAGRLGIDADAFAATIARHNDYAASGSDLEYAKGSTELNRFNGDPGQRPNPCLGRIGTAPFCALEIHAADAASSAGLATDKNGVVLDARRKPIPGLYACGNDAASIMRGTYPGPGTTLGPAMVFGYRIGRHASASANAMGGTQRQLTTHLQACADRSTVL